VNFTRQVCSYCDFHIRHKHKYGKFSGSVFSLSCDVDVAIPKFHRTPVASLSLHGHYGMSVLQLTGSRVSEVRMLVRKLFPPRSSARVPLLLCTTNCGWINVKEARQHMQSCRQEWPKGLSVMTVSLSGLVIKLEAATFLRPANCCFCYEFCNILAIVSKKK
jgi:hypothetical protein